MFNSSIRREVPAQQIFQSNISNNEGELISNAPIRDYSIYIDPAQDEKALENGDRLVHEINKNIIADFEKNIDYCEKNGVDHPDRMVHVSTFKILNGHVYMTYYANTSNDAEDPLFQEARLAFCPIDDPEQMTIVTVQKAGELLDGKLVDRVYDTILLHKDGDELYILWTASVDGLYYRLYCTYNMKTMTLGAIRPNRFMVGDIVNDFSTTGISTALAANGLGHKDMFSDIGIMQKLTTRVEDNETWYYTGAYSGHLNCVIKSKDFITWKYVSEPDFINLSQWENATYVLGDLCFYFGRQFDCNQGFLTNLNLKTNQWSKPVLIRDTQSRSDFVFYHGKLLLIHAPIDREGFGIIDVNVNDISQSKPLAVVRMNDSFFYPYVDIIGSDAYISYTVARKHIRLTKFHLPNYIDI
ncbi:MAG: hypothetical protein GX337_03040 [Christensenellaceae bacterium]|nr:hypothetical protein [Christensenellaceae bacterium]